MGSEMTTLFRTMQNCNFLAIGIPQIAEYKLAIEQPVLDTNAEKQLS